MSTTNQSKIVPKKVLVTGASGLLGVAAIEKFLAAGWKAVGVSRRKPQLPSGRDIDFLSVDLRDEGRARAAFEPLTDITHIAYTALHEKPELVAGWSSKEQIETNNAMLRNVVEPSCAPPPISSTSASCRERRSTACTCTRSHPGPRT
jgi:Nucleoside-diphosphate-sugar epimerases